MIINKKLICERNYGNYYLYRLISPIAWAISRVKNNTVYYATRAYSTLRINVYAYGRVVYNILCNPGMRKVGG